MSVIIEYKAAVKTMQELIDKLDAYILTATGAVNIYEPLRKELRGHIVQAQLLEDKLTNIY